MKLQIVPARTGVQWVKFGIQTFWRRPMALAGLFFLGMASMSLISLLPLIGTPLALALLPCTSLAMMVAAAETTQGRLLAPARLLDPFRISRQRRQAMATLCALYAAGFLTIIGLSALIDGGTFANVYLGREPISPEITDNPEFEAAMSLSMMLYLPLSLLFWHAPGLVYWHGVAPVKALFFSAVACLRNWRAYLMFGLGWVGVFLLSGMALALLTGLLTSLLGAMAGGGLMVTAALVLTAMFFTSVVFTFRDSFSAPDAAEVLEAHAD